MARSRLVLILMAVGALACLVLGCRPFWRAGATPDAGQALGFLSGIDAFRLYYIAALGLLVAGGLTVVFGGRYTGAGLILTGIGIAWFGQNLERRPWVSLVALVVTAFFVVCNRIDSRRKERTLDVLAENIENTAGGEEVKKGVAAAGGKVVRMVRKVITPIKNRLSATGKI